MDLNGANSRNKIHLDFESKSRLNIRDVGSYRYSEDISTVILNAAYKVTLDPWHPLFFDCDTGPEPKLWRPGEPTPAWVTHELWKEGILIEAHNAGHEQGMWKNKCVPLYGWPEVPPKYWTCTAARAAMAALPRALEDVGEALDLRHKKNEEGHRVMLQLARPRGVRKPLATEFREGEPPFITKARKAYLAWKKDAEKNEYPGEYEISPDGTITRWYTPESDPEKFAVLDRYVGDDVLAEENLGQVIDELPPYEREVWLLDQKINFRGFLVDKESVAAGLKIIDAYEALCNEEVVKLTNGFLNTTNQRDKFIQWLQSNGVPMENMQAETVDELLDSGRKIPDNARRLLEIRRSLSKSSTKKLYSMQDNASPTDGRVRGHIMYHAASTGRFGGKNVQPQNLAKPTLEIDYEKDYDLLSKGSYEDFLKRFPDPMEGLSSMLRGFIIAAPGKKFISSDYNSIEARVLAWLAGAEKVLDVFRKGGCIYCYNAGLIYGREITKENNPYERSVGKTSTLALGFQGWLGAFRQMEITLGIDLKMTDEQIEQIAKSWRNANPEITDFWEATEKGAMECVITKLPVKVGYTTWLMKGDFLCCQLPSGRSLYYYKPLLEDVERFGRVKKQLTFLSVNSKTKKWERSSTYAGHLVENITQGCARDIMVNGLFTLEKYGYEVVLHTHDDICCEVPVDFGDVKSFEIMMCMLPKWAAGMPIAASDGWESKRYRK